MERDDIRKWVFAQRWAERRQIQENRRNPISPEAALETAGALLNFAIRLHGWPLPQDRTTRRENERVRDTWVRLRRFYGKP
jgi:hypothetical protein